MKGENMRLPLFGQRDDSERRAEPLHAVMIAARYARVAGGRGHDMMAGTDGGTRIGTAVRGNNPLNTPHWRRRPAAAWRIAWRSLRRPARHQGARGPRYAREGTNAWRPRSALPLYGRAGYRYPAWPLRYRAVAPGLCPWLWGHAHRGRGG